MVLKGKQAFNITGLENYKISTLHIYWYWYKSGFSELIFFINECRSSLVSFTSRIIRVFIRTRTNIFDTLIYVSMNFAWNSRLKDKHFFSKDALYRQKLNKKRQYSPSHLSIEQRFWKICVGIKNNYFLYPFSNNGSSLQIENNNEIPCSDLFGLPRGSLPWRPRYTTIQWG